nr:DUF1365 domain-containing protein [Ponticaulis sp.]
MNGRTAHCRFKPFKRAFSYPVRMVEVCMDNLEQSARQLKWFSVGKWNLLSLDKSKYGDRNSSDLANWAKSLFEAEGIVTEHHSVHLLTFANVLGLGFSPLSLWLLRNEAGRSTAIIYEVHNTFGDQHSYVASAGANATRQTVDKTLHVSPFFDVSGQYRFTLQETDDDLDLLIENIKDGERLHTASLSLTRKPATSTAILKNTLTAPFSGLSVILSIHWQALRLWMRGAKYHRRPAKPDTAYSLTQASSTLGKAG